MIRNILIIGTGAWGKILGNLVSQANSIQFWGRKSNTSEELKIFAYQADIIISAVSMSGVTDIVNQLQSSHIKPNTILVTATKGLDPHTTNTPSQIWQTALPTHPIVVLSGPNLAKEIAQGLPATTVVASYDHQAAIAIQHIFNSPLFRVYTNSDPLGVELGGTLKNIIAIASGTCDGLNLGINAKAGLLTRGLTEMIRIGKTWGSQVETFYGLSGMGDLLATCNSPLSRNYQVGYQLSQGKTLTDILQQLEGTAEGVYTTKVVIQRAQSENISVPITTCVNQLLLGDLTPEQAVSNLMLRETKPEV